MTEPLTITEPGVYDIPVEAYHRDPVAGGSLSSTGARKLLPPSCPAKYRHYIDNGQAPKVDFDIGHAAHKLVLGAGPEIVAVADQWGKNPDEWRTDKVKAAVQAVRDRGQVPLKPADYDRVHAMADAIRAHPWAGRLFAPGFGEPERVIVWRETVKVTNPEPAAEGAVESVTVWCRALLDMLPTPPPGRRLILPDYKTAASAAPEKIERSNVDFGYYIQLAFYLRGLRALGLADDTAQALLAVQEKEEPYLVTVAQPDPTAMRIGAIQCWNAIQIYAECTATGRWPGYSDEVELIALPAWVERQFVGENA